MQSGELELFIYQNKYLFKHWDIGNLCTNLLLISTKINISARINDAAIDEEQGGDNIVFDDVDDDDEDIDDVCINLYI